MARPDEVDVTVWPYTAVAAAARHYNQGYEYPCTMYLRFHVDAGNLVTWGLVPCEDYVRVGGIYRWRIVKRLKWVRHRSFVARVFYLRDYYYYQAGCFFYYSYAVCFPVLGHAYFTCFLLSTAKQTWRHIYKIFSIYIDRLHRTRL